MPDFMDEPLGNFLTVALLLLANAVFVSAEYALVKVRGLPRETLAQNASSTANLHLQIQRNLDTYLATCQLGTTMATLGLGWVLAPAVAALSSPLFAAFDIAERTLHLVSFLSGFLVFSFVHFMVGQQIPKTIAIRNPKPVSLALTYPLHVFYLLCCPLVRALGWVSEKMVSCFGLGEQRHTGECSAAGPFAPTGAFSQTDANWRGEPELPYEFLLFDHRPVKRAMVPCSQVVHLQLASPPEEMLRLITKTTHTRLPLIEGDWKNVVGLVQVQEVLSAAVQGEKVLAKIRSFARDALIVPESEHVAKLFRRMRAKRAPMALVVDEYGEFVGAVTVEDLLDEASKAGRQELEDDETAFGIRFAGWGWEAHGLAPLADVGRITGFYPQPVDANTLSGFFMQRLERMPMVGDCWEENGFRLTVRALQERHVQLCDLVKLPE